MKDRAPDRTRSIRFGLGVGGEKSEGERGFKITNMKSRQIVMNGVSLSSETKLRISR